MLINISSPESKDVTLLVEHTKIIEVRVIKVIGDYAKHPDLITEYQVHITYDYSDKVKTEKYVFNYREEVNAFLNRIIQQVNHPYKTKDYEDIFDVLNKIKAEIEEEQE